MVGEIMNKLTPDAIKKAVDFIEKHKDNPDFKAELAKRNLKLFPNSLKFLIEQLTNLGYQIIPPQKDTKKQEENKSEKVEVQLSMEREIKSSDTSENNNRFYWEKDNTPNNNENNQGLEENPLQEKWTNVLKTIRQNNVMVYSLVVNAKPIGYKDNTITIGFLPQHSYQLKQLQREQNFKHVTDVLKTVFSNDTTLNCIILKD